MTTVRAFYGYLRSSLEDGISFELELRVVWANGQIRLILNKVTALFDESGRPVHVLAVAVDVTERRSAEPSWATM